MYSHLSLLRTMYASAMFSIALAFAQVDSRMHVREPIAIVQQADAYLTKMRKKNTVRRYRRVS